jgi:hypothetical protein
MNILSGPSPRNHLITHAIVACGEQPIWDPHPDENYVLPGEHTHMFLVLGEALERGKIR